MKIITTAAEAHAHVLKDERRPRVLVPTMGALHAGHLELLRVGREVAGQEGELQVSIYVNPLQFEPGSDYERYPRPFSDDVERCREAGVDLIFHPPSEEMYAGDHSVRVEESQLTRGLCGRSRPGHFEGVCIVVAKLFHLLSPQTAMFGEKDYQQLAVIRRLVRDLNFPVAIHGVPTVREKDGLALSSRNQYLSAAERKDAAKIQAALREARAAVEKGENNAGRLIATVRARIEESKLARIDYVEIVDAENLEPRADVVEGTQMAGAVYFGKTRLIDNIRLK